METLWVKSGVEEEDYRAFLVVLKKLRVGTKRRLYNRIKEQKERVSLERLRACSDGPMPLLTDVKASLQTIKQEAGQLKYLTDKDFARQFVKEYDTLERTESGFLGRIRKLELTWKGSTYYIGDMSVHARVLLTVSLSDNVSLVQVKNHERPTEVYHQHPHVHESGKVCFGTWKEMIVKEIAEKNWVRVMVYTAKFLKYYTPEGGPHMKLSAGWVDRLVSGPARCRECEAELEECQCVRGRAMCPKTRQLAEGLPTDAYCGGCTSYQPSISGEVTRMCAWPETAEVYRNRVGIVMPVITNVNVVDGRQVRVFEAEVRTGRPVRLLRLVENVPPIPNGVVYSTGGAVVYDAASRAAAVDLRGAGGADRTVVVFGVPQTAFGDFVGMSRITGSPSRICRIYVSAAQAVGIPLDYLIDLDGVIRRVDRVGPEQQAAVEAQAAVEEAPTPAEEAASNESQPEEEADHAVDSEG